MTRDDDDGRPDESSDDLPVTRRGTLALLGLAGVGGLGLSTGTAGATSARPWKQDVDAQGHALRDLGSLSTRAMDAPVRDFAGAHLSVDDEGALNADEVPDTVHYVNEYPGDTLDQKLRAVIDDIVATGGHQAGHRVVIPPPDPDDPAATGSAWRFEEPVEITDNVGKMAFDLGWTLVFATDTIESFFVVGPDEKTENITIDGGFFYARGNVQSSFLDVQGIGHMDVENAYFQSLEGRDSVPVGVHLRAVHGTSGISIRGCEVTGCTEGLRAEGIFDLDVYDLRAGGGSHAVVLDGCEAVDLRSVQSGGAPIQSIDGDIVRLDNETGPCDNVTVTEVREENNRGTYDTGVHAADSTGGSGGKHRGVVVHGVNLESGRHSTDMEWAINYDQQALTPAPAYSGTYGTTRDYEAGVQTFATASAHEFHTGGEPAFGVGESDVELHGAGEGVVLTTPDGQSRYRVRVDDDGTLVTEEVQEAADRSGIVDSFEDGDLSEYFGATDAYAVTTDPPVSDGDYSLKNTTGDTAIFGSREGLPRYPQAGDTFSATAARTDANPNLGVAFGMQDTNNFYFARIYPEGPESEEDSDRLQLYKRANGSYTQLAKSVADVVTGTLYEFVVDWGKTGEISVSVRDPDGDEVSAVSATDTTFTEGGVGARRTGVLDEIQIL